METVIFSCLSALGGVGLTLYVVIKYYNNVRIILSDVTSILASTFGWCKSEHTKLKIETNGATSIDRLNQVVPELNLPELAIEWVKPDEHGKVRLEPGKAIVLLKYDKDNTQNIINTTSIYVQNTLLNKSKPFLDSGIKKAVDFAIIREFLSKTPQKDYIVTQYVDTCTEDFDRYGDTFNKVTKVENEGLLVRVLLREYAVWGNKLVGRIRNEDLVNESKCFLDFIYNIASREFDELTPLVFNDATLKVAILLVAKYDTYVENGIKPYVRRIREEFANGINTFYLLARNEKIDILNEVYGQLISSGSYNLLNGPEVYKDNLGRDNICYCIEVKHDADMAKTYASINEFINNEKTIECSVTSVRRNEILCDYNSLPVVIVRNEITDSTELRIKNYYTTGMTIEVMPLKLIEGGKIYGSLLNTKSNPAQLFNNNFSVNSTVIGVVQNTNDDFITLLVKGTDQRCVAFRRNLTYSRFVFLHKLFPVGSEFEFIVKSIDYINNSLELKLSNLPDPWDGLSFHEGQDLDVPVLLKKETCIETELTEGVFAILPNSELSWFDDIDKIKDKIKINSMIRVCIKRIDRERKLIILSYKDRISPYLTYFRNLPTEKNIRIKIESQNTYGIIGVVDLKYRVFIPNSETYIGQNRFNVKINKSFIVHIKEVDKNGRSLIGTFKPFIEPPLKSFKENFTEGQVLSHLKFIRATENGVYFLIRYKGNKSAEALLLNSEVSDSCFIKDTEKIFGATFTCPLKVKDINLDRNIIYLSLKDLTTQNADRVGTLNFGKVYSGKVLGVKNGGYCILLENIWIEIYIKSSKSYAIGDCLEVMKASSTEFMDASEV